MKRIIISTLSLLLLTIAVPDVRAQTLISIDSAEVTICPAQPGQMSPPSFNEVNCRKTHATNIDPQNKAIWVKAKLIIPRPMLDSLEPHSVYIFGKTSSKVYFNGQDIGENGTPNHSPRREFPGKMDAMFYVPPNLINQNTNELVLLLSSHHGFLNLKNPLHFIGFGEFSDPIHILQQNVWRSLVPLGALILGALYFAVAAFNPYRRQTNVLFLLMSLIAAGQLFAELSRALFSYSYPLHDVRLLLIASLSVAFGICLLVYITTQFSRNSRNLWVIAGSILTLICVFLVPGFDSKTAIAILIPTFLSTIIIAIQAIKFKTMELWIYLAFFALFTVTIVMTLNEFHDLIFYYIITTVLCFLFIQQALQLNREQSKRKQEQQQVAKLQFILEQNEQKVKPSKIKISSAGKIEIISSDQLIYCKASGDYVELYLKDKKQHLYSGNLKELAKLLPSTFLRVHRSYIVNTDFVISLNKINSDNNKTVTGGGFLKLAEANEVPVSRRIMPMVRNVIGTEKSINNRSS